MDLSSPLLSRPQQQQPTCEERGHHSLFLFCSLFSQGWKEQRSEHGSKEQFSLLFCQVVDCGRTKGKDGKKQEHFSFPLKRRKLRHRHRQPTAKTRRTRMNGQRAKELKSPRSPQRVSRRSLELLRSKERLCMSKCCRFETKKTRTLSLLFLSLLHSFKAIGIEEDHARVQVK
jgi:hypothetical protein